MTETTVAADIHQALDVHLNSLAQIAFNLTLGFQHRANPAQLVFIQVLDSSLEADTSFLKNGVCSRASDAVDISQPNLRPFVGWKIHPSYTCHLGISLSLSLFVFRINADHPNHTFAVDDLALITHLFH